MSGGRQRRDRLVRLQRGSLHRDGVINIVEEAIAEGKRYHDLEQRYLKMPDTIKMHQAILQYGAKEPYATNIIIRLFAEAYTLLNDKTFDQ